MLLHSLAQINFRNITTAKLDFPKGITALIGKNASGKSNMLDGIYLACTGELARGKISEAIKLGEAEGFVSAKLEHADGLSTTEVGLAPGRKLIRLDSQTVRSIDLAKVASAVLITPDDISLVHGSPSLRRAYLDGLLAKLSFRYALVLREYNRVVEQRNAALKTLDPSLTIWTEKFLELGTEIIDLRKRAIKRIHDIAEESYQDIASDKKQLSVSLNSKDHPSLEEQLNTSKQEERLRGVTLVGPHREDLRLTLDDHSVQAYGSRGEARTTALAMRIAEYQLLFEKHKEAPILLLDDFTAELDVNRRTYLLELAAKTPQTILTGTETPESYTMLYHVSNGGFLVS